jgi:hypothetical protein
VGSAPGGKGGPTQPPAATPTATPPAAPTPKPPISQSCAKLPPGDPEAPCRREPPDFRDQVDEAIRTLQAEQPGVYRVSCYPAAF